MFTVHFGCRELNPIRPPGAVKTLDVISIIGDPRLHLQIHGESLEWVNT